MTQEHNADLWESVVFATGEAQPWYVFRIPSLVTAASGRLLAFCEGRDIRTKGGDHARNDIVMKRSDDGGRTWAPLEVVASDGDNSLNNPTAVVVRDTGRVLLMYQRYPYRFHAAPIPSKGFGGVEPGYEGERVCRTFLVASDDEGETWSAPREITRSVKRPTEATASIAGPGVGIQLRRGERAGRVVMPYYQHPRPDKVYAVYSDDLGETWAYSECAENPPEGTGNENQMVELADGRVMVNSRRSGGSPRRKIAFSGDGGETWTRLADEPSQPGPGCQGSILRYTDPLDGHRSRIVFSNPASETRRENGTIRLSYDEGKTWPVAKALRPEGMFAYSCLGVTADMRIGCLHEGGPDKDGHPAITFASLALGWLTDGRDPNPER